MNIDNHHNKLYSKAYKFLENLKGKSILLTGMTGLFGIPMIEFLCRFKESINDQTKIYILSRNRVQFIHKYSQKSFHKFNFVEIIEGDIKDFSFNYDVDFIIHGASTSNREKFEGISASERFDIIFSGTKNIIDIAESSKAQKVLFVSSGSVYGGTNQEKKIKTNERVMNAPDVINDSEACYSEGKRVAELMLSIASKEKNLNFSIARCFSFVGPGIPLDINYSIGNFIGDALFSDSIKLTGDGSPVRSYMYTYDLAVWLLCILTNSNNKSVYNVGSDEEVSILNLAKKVGSVLNPNIVINRNMGSIKGVVNSSASNYYVPDISKARNELGLQIYTSLKDSILLTALHEKNDLLC